MAATQNAGFSPNQRTEIAAGLNKVLADSYALYLKTHGYHWNVRGANFQSLHVLLEGQYQEEWAALDLIAERIRALGELAPQGYAAFGNLSSIKDGDGDQAWEPMLKELLRDNETVIATLRGAFPTADEAGDEATTDLITQRLQAHEKHAWMLRATLGLK
ncbi:MAG: starvation/stationary phase protection protein [Caulobacter sp.]|jgi:starvation-inducible DNA-binding protein|nr:starvation/stationary phase protection protein [Caulobacter sp.]